MKLVIEIDEERYIYIKNQVEEGIDNPLKVIIAEGTPLSTDAVDRVTIKEYLESFGKDTSVTAMDCISREAFTDTTICEGISCNECAFNTCEDGQSGCLLQERVDKLPPVIPQPKMGQWIKHSTYYDCSLCGCIAPCTEMVDRILWKLTNYCPDCGAKMQEAENDERGSN